MATLARGRGMKWAFWFRTLTREQKRKTPCVTAVHAHKRVMTAVPLQRPDWGQSAQQRETEVRVTSALKPYGFSCSVWAGAGP